MSTVTIPTPSEKTAARRHQLDSSVIADVLSKLGRLAAEVHALATRLAPLEDERGRLPKFTTLEVSLNTLAAALAAMPSVKAFDKVRERLFMLEREAAAHIIVMKDIDGRLRHANDHLHAADEGWTRRVGKLERRVLDVEIAAARKPKSAARRRKVDTSDIPETPKRWFKKAKLRKPVVKRKAKRARKGR